ncbi:hypothetical protein Pla123a_16100 [Posidoniimonas polymericola]|uniref:Uncharacterized protein n=1 Tax=Posidoniimonas polymericola TaxID=2528002 RepID=A0A5C5YS51_9BACT|nr:hypothetical protein Pla123a_16100 [Posidoniimonas polymericola]
MGASNPSPSLGEARVSFMGGGCIVLRYIVLSCTNHFLLSNSTADTPLPYTNPLPQSRPLPGGDDFGAADRLHLSEIQVESLSAAPFDGGNPSANSPAASS